MLTLTPSPTPSATPSQVRHRPVPDVATTLWCRGAEGGREGGRKGGGDQGVGMRHTVVLK